MAYKIIKRYMTHNDCYRRGYKRSSTKGIVKHSTGANNPNLKRYINDPERLGRNQYGNHYDQPGISKCVHFWIGLDKNKKVVIYQTLPLDYRCWGCGSGSKGSYNNTHIQYEICEDGLTNSKYFKEVFEAAAWLDSYICKKYNLPASSIVSHKEAHNRGYASNHGDCDHWLRVFGKNMAWCRNKADKLLFSTSGSTSTYVKYKVSTNGATLALRAAAGTSSKLLARIPNKTVVAAIGKSETVKGAKWLQVKANGKIGWMHSGYLKKIKSI